MSQIVGRRSAVGKASRELQMKRVKALSPRQRAVAALKAGRRIKVLRQRVERRSSSGAR